MIRNGSPSSRKSVSPMANRETDAAAETVVAGERAVGLRESGGHRGSGPFCSWEARASDRVTTTPRGGIVTLA